MMAARNDNAKQRLVGALLSLALLALAAGGLSARVPLSSPAGTLARVFDSLAPHLLALAAFGALAVILLGARRLGLGLLGLVLIAAGALALGHVRRSHALLADADPALRILFFNVETHGALPPALPPPGEAERARRIAAAVRAADADVVAFAESEMLLGVLPELRTLYPHHLGCGAQSCEILLMSRHPLEEEAIDSLGRLWSDRFVRARVRLPDGRAVVVVAVHLSKPWFSGTIESELHDLSVRLDPIRSPLVVVGDFNASPWSNPLQGLMERTGLAAARRPVPTWPAAAGALGVPIDNIFVRSGARLTALDPFGGDLGSNHRGILAGIALP